MTQWQLDWYGRRGLLLRGLTLPERLACEQQLTQKRDFLHIDELVPGYDSLLILLKTVQAASYLKQQFRKEIKVKARSRSDGRLVKIPVTYDGPDLASVAKQISKTVEEVIALHSEPEYQVRLMGFSPGFPYLDGLPKMLHLPRKGVPLDYIEPGTVAIGGAHASIYTVGSPGGWHLLGKTNLQLFNPSAAKGNPTEANAIFQLKVGDRVRFVPTTQKGGAKR